MNSLNKEIERIMIKYMLIDFSENSIIDTFEQREDGYLKFLNSISNLLENEKEFFLIYKGAKEKVDEIIYSDKYRNIKTNNKKAELIRSFNEINNQDQNVKKEKEKKYLKDQIYSRFINKFISYGILKNKDLITLRVFTLLLERNDYIYVNSLLKGNVLNSFDSEFSTGFITSTNYLSNKIPELFTDEVIKDILEIYDTKFEKDDVLINKSKKNLIKKI